MKTERRQTSAAGVKVETREGGKRVITGYAAVYYDPSNPGTEYCPFDGFCERIKPGAFDRALREKQDVIAVVNHDDDQLLGRTTSGTCRLSVDAKGLRYEIDPPNTSAGNDAIELITRGDISGSSFAFVSTSETWEMDQKTKEDIRWINEVDLVDVCPVVNPAYAATSTNVRADDVETARELVEKKRQEREAVAVRKRLAMVDAE